MLSLLFWGWNVNTTSYLLSRYSLAVAEVSALAADRPISFEADQVTVNKDTGSMLATGNVVLRQNGTKLIADEVTHDQELDAIARGSLHDIRGRYRAPRRFYDA